ncbi:thiamine diphosphokinase [candidate division KSB1 bacterium]
MEKRDPASEKQSIRAIIFANAPIPSKQFVEHFIQDGDLIICADGGANRIVGYDISPDFIVGDLDSVSLETVRIFQNTKIVRMPEQNNTDLFKSLQFAKKRGIEEVLIFGATGARPDHFLGNLSLLEQFSDSLDIQMIDEDIVIVLVKELLQITGAVGQTVSLWPFSEKVSGVTTEGLEYQLSDETLFKDTRGISNKLNQESASISIKNGSLIAIIHHPEHNE